MTALADRERAEGVPLRRRSGVLVATAAASYLAIAAVVAFYLLPVGFGLTSTALLLGQVAVILVGAALVAFAAAAIRRHAVRQAALYDLVERAGWRYTPDVSARLWGGSIDEQIDRRARASRDHIDAMESDPPFDAALRTFSVGEGEGARLVSTLALRIPLPAEAPRITLRSRSGRGALSSLPSRPARGAELRLEGDFSDVFEVSVPAGYETAALYVLTPDLMVALLDNADDVDMEVVGGVLHVYLAPLDLTDPGDLARLLNVAAVLHDGFFRRTRRYRDENAPAPTGRRTAGDTLASAARTLETRVRMGPVVLAVLAPFVPLAVGLVWMQITG
ncbi:hypothetical protein [Microbacterium halophytorum]|uniref:hypothetical protein n=1 Tax=Microbacterium halophytorum TaxID=2067568 RepID=UPI001E3EC376|nr:hypothetical protein [Microbacterium halophytorum]